MVVLPVSPVLQLGCPPKSPFAIGRSQNNNLIDIVMPIEFLEETNRPSGICVLRPSQDISYPHAESWISNSPTVGYGRVWLGRWQ